MRAHVLLAATLPCAIALAAPPETDWHLLPAFSADPALLLREGAKRKPQEGHAVHELLEDTRVTFDAQGRRETVYRYVFKVDHESGVNAWRTVGCAWAPWHQERPVIRARVITPDGRVHTLDPGTLGEFPMNEDDTTLYDDRRKLAGPLPQLALGAVAEVEIVTRETAPVHASGTLVSFFLHQSVPVERTRVRVDVPGTLPFQWKLSGLGPVQPQETRADGRIRLAVDLGPMEPPEEREAYADPEAQPRPRLTFSTVPSWAAAAASYLEIAERQIAGSDLAAWARTALGDATEPREKINRLLAHMNRTIRYTGVEFGEAGIVPRTPAETLKRGYGDCKDKAALLVALLRQAGIEARLALLETGPGQDVDPALPGLNHFDHAIVVVPGPEPLWIDATAEFARAGDLPFMDQGRLALIVDRATTGLVTIPAAPSTANLALETREVFLADSGKARVVETSHPSGLAEMKLRSEFPPADPKKQRENLKKYMQGAYAARDLGACEVAEAADLGRPFTLRLEALDCEMGITTDVDALVTLNAWDMSSRLRKLIPTSYDRKAKEPAQRRKQDLILPEPYAVEWRYRIAVPAGFEARPLPPSDRLPFGPASLERTFAKSPEGLILATFRFDSGKARWTPAEVEAAREALEAFGASAPTRLLFDQVGEAHLAAGRVKEAIQTFRTQAEAQPTKGIPLSRLAIALLRAGLGGAARDAARKACTLEPTHMFTHRALGWVYLHDLVNRAYHPGWDRAGALAAYRRARELAPQDALTRKNLAILLEHNPEGVRYGPGADLDGAVKEYRDLRKDLKVEDMNVNLLTALWRAGRYGEVEACARTLPVPREGHAWFLAAVAATRGGQAAITEGAGFIPDQGQRRTALLEAGDLLAGARKYDEAATLLSAGADGAANAPAIRGRVAVLARTRPFDARKLDPAHPATPVWRLLQIAAAPGATDAEFFDLFTPALRANMGKESGVKDFRKGLGFNTQKRDGTGVAPVVTVDVLRVLSQVVVTGDAASGFKVALKTPGANDDNALSWFVAQDQGRLLLAATDTIPSTLGIEARRRLERGDEAGARAMLDHALEQVRPGTQDDPLSGHPFRLFWEKGRQGAPAEIRLAAAALEGMDKDCAGAMPILREDPPSERRDLVLMNAHLARSEWAAALPLAERLLKAHPASKVATRALGGSLNGTRQWTRLLAAANDALAGTPDDDEFTNWKAKALGMLGRHQEREDVLKALVDSGKATSADFNNLAWGTLVRDRVTDQSVEWARRSVLLKAEKNDAAQNTLAALLAERGETAEALDIFQKEMSNLEEDEPRSQDWYLLGRIAEQMGETAAAIDSYRRVTPPKEGAETEIEMDTCHALAARRLRHLRQAPTV